MSGTRRRTDWPIPQFTVKQLPTELQPTTVQTPLLDNDGLRSKEERRDRISSDLRRRTTLTVERFPVSILLLLQYGAMVLLPALTHHAQSERLIFEVCLGGIALAFTIECILLAVSFPPRSTPKDLVSPRLAIVVLVVGMLAQVGVVLDAGGQPNIVSFFTALTSWLTFGSIMFLWLWRQGIVSRRVTWIALAVVELFQLALVVKTGTADGLAALSMSLVLVAVLVRFVRLRWLVVGVVLVPLLWPIVYRFHEGARHSQSATYSSSALKATSPDSRANLKSAHIAELPTAPVFAVSPSLSGPGLFPGLADSNRPNLRTAERVTVTEPTRTASVATLTTLGDAYALHGPLGVAIDVIPVTLAMGWAIRRRSPWGYMVAGVLVTSGIWIESTYPDYVTSIFQSLVSLLVVWILVLLVTWRVRSSTRAEWPDRGESVANEPFDPPTLDLSQTTPASTDVLYDSGAATTGGLRQTIGRASILNIAASAASAIAGLLAARYLGPSVKGQYAAVTAWFGAALVLGEVGQQSAIVYYVAHAPERARDYVATSRNIMLATGAAAAIVGIFLAPHLSHHVPSVTLAYRALFLCSPFVFIGGSFMFALQARSIQRWMITRTVQPVAYLVLTVTLIATHLLTLDRAVLVVIGSLLVQALVAYRYCERSRLLGGNHDRRLGRDVLGYGTSQLLATTPTAVNTNLDQILLSQSVPSASLGQYALAASLTSVATPLVAPIGSVLFPRLAAGSDDAGAAKKLQWTAVLVTLGLAAAIMAILAAVAMPIIPSFFGAGYRPSVMLVWIMAPSGVFLALNQVVGDLLRGRGQPLAVALSQGAGAALTVVLLIILIPIIGVVGAAVTTTVTYGITTAIMLLALRRHPQPVGGARGADAQKSPSSE